MHHSDRNAHHAWADPRSRARPTAPRQPHDRQRYPWTCVLFLAVVLAAGSSYVVDSLHMAARIIAATN